MEIIELAASDESKFGMSFKGAIDYLMKGKKGEPKPERVTYHETVHLMGDIHSAAYEMRLTSEYRDALLKRKPAKKKRGEHDPDVYHFVLSWKPEENPPEGSAMAAHAKQVLELIGLGEHEAVIVCHGDTDNPHAHVIVNRVNPHTGQLWKPWLTQNTMIDYAYKWMVANGNVLWEKGAGKGQRLNRAAYERKKAEGKALKRKQLPAAILEKLTERQSTFTDAQLAKAVTDMTTSPQEFAEVLKEVRALPEFMVLEGEARRDWFDQTGGLESLSDKHRAAATSAYQEWRLREKWNRYSLASYVKYVQDRAKPETVKRYTSKPLRAAEERIALNAARLAGREGHRVNQRDRESARQALIELGIEHAVDQTETLAALDHLLDASGLGLVVGYAGAGKSTLLKYAAKAWTASGYNVRGLAIAGRTAESLQIDAKINSTTIAYFLKRLEHGRDSVRPNDVFVIDESGMVDSRQMDALVQAIHAGGGKVVMAGDPEQLQAIGAGGPFGFLLKYHASARLTKIHRQRKEWMQKATVDLAEARTREALDAYKDAGAAFEHETKDDAIAAIMDEWQAGWDIGGTQIVMTSTNADCALITAEARDRMRAAGKLGPDHPFNTHLGRAFFAVGDRFLFKLPDKQLGVINGNTGTVVEIAHGKIIVETDAREGTPPRRIEVDPTVYSNFTTGYAATLHFAQGISVSRAYVLASTVMDRHGAYVALSRHRDRVAFHWSKSDFNSWDHLTKQLSRKRLKETSLDFRASVNEALRAKVADLAKGIDPANEQDQISAWTQLYNQQRAEQALYGSMSAFARAFWWAANVTRYMASGAFNLKQLHEKERIAMAAALQKLKTGSRRKTTEKAPSQTATKQPKPKMTKKVIDAAHVLFNTART